ncbi:hypothetical protein NUU61_003935 [Penicillium alfredii]|uniref:Carbonic anhydrase n=1 Tax=Penicillium alfredii TaxID=1506179 RepID=A0A9W9KDF8_9EURO|nr:uncharacterized protein NUU61_003935 [Penicillium alfredii]KAJ5101713.1 hypothetical protein NUU61_003935 [Penicillium alfredii]
MAVARLAPRPGFLSRATSAAWDISSRRPAVPCLSIRVTRSPFSTSSPLSCASHKSTTAQPPSNANANSNTAAKTDSASSSTDRYASCMKLNQEWAAQTARDHPDLFPTLATGQKPQILWIGCSDSRCPETTLLGMQPGDVFVHRNIANVLHPGDLSSSAVIEYAVAHLGVNHVILCGHTACGGVAAALGNKQLGILDPWLLPLRQVRERNLALLESLSPQEAALKLVELNVREGLNVIKQKGAVLDAIEKRGLQVHGMIYDVGSGALRELNTEDSEEAIKARLSAFKTEA